MIVVDSSVFVAIFKREPEAELLSQKLSAADHRVMSAANHVECAMVSEGRFGGRADLDAWFLRRDVKIHAFDHTLAQLAADAFVRFGKGRHSAGLNYGDCFAYALAESLSAPLLFKGLDFARTDLVPA